MTNLTRDDILKLARLSKLDLADDQIDRFRNEIESVVQYIEHLQAADVEGLEPTNQVSGRVNSTRKDEIREYVSPDELLKNLPDSENGQIKVKRMIG